MSASLPEQAATLSLPSQAPAEAPTLSPSSSRTDGLTADVPVGTGFEVLAELGRGGMGVVYKARQVSLNRLVALKMILAGGHAGEGDLQRFRAEAEAVARLQHPNIVQIHEVGESEGRPFFSLEFVDGGSLADRLDGTPWPAVQAAQLVKTLAGAIHAAHLQGIIHRDLKPGNVLLTADGTPKITDFGLAKQLNNQHGQTATGAVLGTPSYMAPEQAGGKSSQIGPAADVYSLGAILYELVTGRPPFRAETPLDTVMQVVSEEPIPPRRLVPKLPRDLETICLKCLEKSPAKRYATAADLADDLERWLSTRPIRARRIGPVGRAARWCRRNPVLTTVCSLAALVIVTLSSVYYVSLLRENKHTREARDQAERERDQAEAAREAGQDTLARSQYEQARALRLAHQPGWRWQALDLLREAETLRARRRRDDLPSLPNAVQSGRTTRLPSRAELRREAAEVLLLDDARPLAPITLAASIGQNRYVSADGRRAVAAFVRPQTKPDEKTHAGIRCFDLSTGGELGELRDLNLALCPLAMSPDGATLAYLDFEQIVRLLDLPAGTVRATLPAPKEAEPALGFTPHRSLVYGPDGRSLAAALTDEKRSDVFLWDLRDPAASRHLARVDAPVGSLAFRRDGRMLAYPAGGSKLALVDVEKRSEPRFVNLSLPLAPPNTDRPFRRQMLAWSPRSDLLAVGCIGPASRVTILFWNMDRQAEEGSWNGGFDLNTVRLAFFADGKRVAAGDKDGTIRVFDIAAQHEVLRLEAVHPGGVGLLQGLEDGRLLSADTSGNAYSFWEPSADRLTSVVMPGKEKITDLTFSPDGRSLAILSRGAQPSVILVEPGSGRPDRRFEVHAPSRPFGLRFRADGQQLALFGEREVQVWNLPDRREKTYGMASGAAMSDPAFLADGRLLVVETVRRDQDLRLTVRDVVSGEPVGPGVITKSSQKAGPFVGIPGSTLSADGRVLVNVQPQNETILLWDIPSGNYLGELKSPEPENAIGCRLSADRRWLYVFHAPSNNEMSMVRSQIRLRIWDVANRREQWDPPRSGDFSVAVFSPDSRLLGIGYENGSADVLDIQERELLFQWRPLGGDPIKHLAFTPDGAFLACAGGQGPIHLLHLKDLRRQLADMGLDW
jgi:WD40 repeat protein